MERVFRRDLRSRKKRGPEVGKTKKGKGSKLMILADGEGIPVAVGVHSASPHEVKLAEPTIKKLDKGFRDCMEHLVADNAYDALPLRKRLKRQGIELISPHKSNRVNPVQDGRRLRRYRRRWKIERTNAWIQNFRRLVTRWERSPQIFLAFLKLACIIIVIRHL
jgi:transposase